MKNCIDYKIISSAIEYYQNSGFQYVDVEWKAPVDIVKITTPPQCRLYKIDPDKSLVASAEQSFLDMIINQHLKPGKYVAASPCFRDDIIDETHGQYFFKVELIDFEFAGIDSIDIDAFYNTLTIAQEFFNKYLPTKIIHLGGYNYDIVDVKNEIELGSYGIREYNNVVWIFATGVAEPRLSITMQMQ